MPWERKPEIIYYMRELRLRDELREQGIVLTDEQLRELAHASVGPEWAWAEEEQDPNPPPELAEFLDQIRADAWPPLPPTDCQGCYIGGLHRPCTRGQDEARDALSITPKAIEYPKSDKDDQGQGGSHSRAQHRGSSVRNEKIDPIKEYLEKVPDPPDEDWS
jgi:hypothetical protein